MGKKENVRQHVVPRFYLEGFADATGQVHALEVSTGKVFTPDPRNICVEKEAYSIVDNGVLDKSCDQINNDVEGPVSLVLAKIHPDIDLTDLAVASEVFTHLLAFTGNLIARSRIPRDERNSQVSSISSFLSAHPEAFDNIDHERYLDALRNPEKYPGLYERFPMLAKFRTMLLQCNDQDPGPPKVADTLALFKKLKTDLYPVLTPVLTGKVTWAAHDLKAKGALLVSDSINFITSDDPVIYLHDDVGVKGKQIPESEYWTDPNRAVFLPLKPRVALYWNANENYELKPVTAERVAHLNKQVMANHVRQVFAADPGDFPVAE